jgi:hypothetical protein
MLLDCSEQQGFETSGSTMKAFVLVALLFGLLLVTSVGKGE